MYARMSAACLVLVLAVPGLATSQVLITGTMEVVIEDAQGGRLPGVVVSAHAGDTVTTRQAVTNAEGTAILEALAPSTIYVITATLSGFRELTRPNVLVRSGQVTSLHEVLDLATVTDQITVVGQTAPVIDVKRAVAGQDITLQLTESLPTGRSYQSYLQLVPGVLPDSPNAGGNPSSRSGMNWKTQVTGDSIGVSTDNFYYVEGINVTDPVLGTFGANLNTEIIQEQHVYTGGLPAELVGASGLVSTVITKSGSNRYAGSANSFFQNDKLVAANAHDPDNAFNTRDTAFTMGGPVLRTKVWAFGSVRSIARDDDVSAQDTHVFVREVETRGQQAFVKGSWSPSSADLVSVMFLNDPQKRDGSIDPSVVATRDRARRQGGSNSSFAYNRVSSSLLIDGAINQHDAELTDLALDRTVRNTVIFQRTDARTLADEQLGGFGQDAPETRPTWQGRAIAQYVVGTHRMKGGFEFARHEDHRNLQFTTSSDPAQYTSISTQYAGASITATDLANSTTWSGRQFNATNPSDYTLFITAINALPNRAAFYAAFDTDNDGTISQAELGNNLVFDSTAGNPHGQINYYRNLQTALGRQDQKLRGYTFFGQDEFSFKRTTVNVGLRAEQWSHFATTGTSIHDFGWTLAPRASAAFDVRGNGRQKASAFYGRYYDPIRMDMTNFAGTLTGQTREEQVFALGQWVTYRTRGGAATQDGVFAPNTNTPYTAELQVQYEADLGHNMSGSATYYHRATRDIFEDFDPNIYWNPAAYPGPVNDPDSLFLGYGYLGVDPAHPPVSNFYLATLEGGERNYHGIELTFRKRFADRLQSLVSYNYLDATGNTVSDGDADFAGDVLELDPRAPNNYGTVAGTIHHMVKAAGSYTLPMGLEFGASYRWNSGAIVDMNQFVQNRRIPIVSDAPFTFAGITQRWTPAGAIGGVQNPPWGSFDARIKYVRRWDPITTELFADIFNVFNDQAPTRVEDLVSGTGTTRFLDEIQWNTPRRASLGVRVSF